MPDENDSSALVVRNGSRGRPTKKTPQRCKALCAAIRAGLPYKVACQSIRIDFVTFLNWRRSDKRFDQAVGLAEAEAIRENLEIIKEARRENWPAAAWVLERRHAELFAKPEVQLAVNTQVNAPTVVSAADFRALVVSDLEYLALKEQPSYTHHPKPATQARELEQVSTELAGHLSRQGGGNGLVISQSQAQANAERLARIRARTEKLLRATGSGQASTDQSLVAGEQSQAAAESLPAEVNSRAVDNDSRSSAKPAKWWARFIFPGTLIPKADAILALRLLLSELGIAVDERALDFETDHVVQAGFCKALEELSKSDLGWRTMVQLYEQQLQREQITH